MIYIISGKKNEGKTKTQSIICSIIKNKPDNTQWNSFEVDLDGFICNKYFIEKPLHSSIESYEKDLAMGEYHIGYDLIRVSDNKTVPFIRLVEYSTPDFDEGFQYGPFIFFKRGIDAGKKILQKCYLKKTKNVIVDEIGKLELDGKVFAAEIQELVKCSDTMNLFI